MFEGLKLNPSLGSDNHSAVHPKIMQALFDVNRGGAHAYGMDEVSDLAQQEFARVFGENVEAHLVFTGTAANVLCLSPLLKSFESVICSEVAHLHIDECGAPEKFWGSKLWPIPSKDGKIRPQQIEELLTRGGDQHFSQPRAVSLTQPTELGICYTMEELREWREFTHKKNLMLHIDGARLSNAAAFLNVSLKNLTADIGVDVVSFGGTKNGLMGAEACLLFSSEAKKNFKFYRKQAMQLSSKTRYLAAQFYAYLKDDLWLEIAKHSISQAQALGKELNQIEELELAFPVESNALFVHVPKSWIAPLREEFFFYVWDNRTQLCRWMTSFAWTADNSARVLARLHEVRKCFPVK